MASAMDMFFSAPPVTRTLTTATFLISVLVYSGVLAPYYIMFYHSKLLQFPPQLWRLATCFMLSQPKLGILMDPYYMYTYGKKCEVGSPKITKPGDFFVYIVFVCSAIFGINYALFGSASVLTGALIAAFAYTACQDEPGSTRIFILNVPTRAVPFMLCFMTFVTTGSVQAGLVQGTGILAAHLYDFLTRIYPEFGGGPNILATPAFVQRWLSSGRPFVSQRPYGVAFQPAAPRSAASSSSANVLPESWRNRGSGRRLGGE